MPAVPSRSLPPGTGRRRLAGVLLVAGAVVNCAFLLGPLAGVPLDPLHSFISGLSARGEPSAGLFRGADLLTGTLLLLAALVSWREVPATPWLRVAQWSLVAFAACTAADGLLPMDCDPGGDAACRAAEAAGAVSWQHQVHSVTGVVESGAAVVATAGLALGTRRIPGWQLRARLWAAAAAALVVLAVTISVQYLLGTPWVGVSQRLFVLAWAAAVGLAGAALVRDARRDWPRPSWPAPDPATLRTLEVGVPGHPGTRVRVEVHHRQAAATALVSGGLGLPLELWHPVAAELPDVCLVLVDRPGLGGSSPWSGPPGGLADQVAVLDAALAAADRPGGTPVVVVGHSYGGVLAEAYARLHPDRVGALVLVDPSDPSAEAAHPIRPGALLRFADRTLARPRWARVVGRVVGWSVAAAGTGRVDARLLPPAGRATYRTSRHLRATLLELQRAGPESAELLALSHAQPHVGRPTLLLIARWGGWPLYRIHRRWIERMAALGARIGAQATVVAGAHLLMLDAPDAVAREIRRAAQRSTQA